MKNKALKKFLSMLLIAGLLVQEQGIVVCAEEIGDSAEETSIPETEQTEPVETNEAETAETEQIEPVEAETAETEQTEPVEAETAETEQTEPAEEKIEAVVTEETEPVEAKEAEITTVTQNAAVPVETPAQVGFSSRWVQPVPEISSRGAAATGAQLNFSNVTREFNVMDYGASETASNNYKAFQDAIDAAHEYQEQHPGEQCKVLIPAGTYNVKDKNGQGLVIYSNLWIYAEGATIKRTTTNKRNLMQTVASGSGYEVTKNVLIEGGIWDGQGSITKNTNPIFRFVHASDIAFLNCTVQDAFNAHQLEMGGIRGFTVLGSTFKDYSQDKESLKKEAIQLDICNNSSIMPGCEIYDDALCQNVIIKGNTFTNLYRALGTHSAVVGKYMTDISITDNTFSDIKGKAVGMYNYKNCSIRRNTFINCSEAVDFRSVSMSETYNMNFYAPADGSMVMPSPLAANLLISENNITKDTLEGHDSPGAAIRVFGTNVITPYISENRVVVPVGDYPVIGVYIENNQISGKGAGIILNNVKNAQLSNNAIYACEKHGLQITENSEVALNGGDQIYGNTKNGISNGASKLRINGNTNVYRNGGTGVYLYNGSSNVYLKDLNAFTNQGAAVTFTGASSGTLKNPTFTDNQHHGVIVEKNSGLEIKGGLITGSALDGVYVNASRLSLYSGSVITNNKRNGVSLSNQSSGTKISKAEISSNRQKGILVSGNSFASLKSGTKLISNKQAGIAATSSTVKIYGCVSSNNGGSGVELSSTVANLKGNTISNNQKSGINVEAGKLTIKSNQITGNRKYGVALYKGSNVTSLRENVFSNGAKKEIVVKGGSKAPVKTTKAVKVNTIKKSAKKITGNAQTKLKVTATCGKKKLGSTKVSKKGTYSIKIKKQKQNALVTITVQDAKKNQFQQSTVVKK